VAGEVAARELGEGGVAIDRLRPRHALVEQRIGQLIPAPRTAADDGIQLGTHRQERQPHAGRDDAGSAERGTELGARQ